MAIIHHSPRADVDIPDRSITAHVFRNASEHPDRVALDRRAQRTLVHLLRALRCHHARGPGLPRGRHRHRRRRRDHGAQRPRVRDRLPRRGERGGHRHHGQPHLQSRRDRVPARRRRRPDPGHRRPVPRDGPRRGGRERRPAHRRDRRRPRGRARHRRPLRRAARRAAARAGRRRSRRRRRAAVLVRHDRPVEGRDAHPPQPRREHRAGSRTSWRWTTTTSSWPCCRSSTSTACRCS